MNRFVIGFTFFLFIFFSFSLVWSRETPLDQLQHRDPSNFFPLEEIYLGGRVPSELSKPIDIDATALQNFCLRCLPEFYIEGAIEIFKRFLLDNAQMTRLEAIDPHYVLNATETCSFSCTSCSLVPIISDSGQHN